MTHRFMDAPDPHHDLMNSLCKKFNIADDDDFPHIGFRVFSFGACHGQYRRTPDGIDVLSVVNRKPGNGDFVKLMFHFERQVSVRVLHVWNARLADWLSRRGYERQAEHYVRAK